jgi:hypothetical protein
LREKIKEFQALQRQMNVGPDRPKWVKGANGLWHSFDPVAQRKRERVARKAAKDAAKLAAAA